MPKYFPGVTHHIVHTVTSEEDMLAMNGTVAFVVHCFGNDNDKLLPIRIKKVPGNVPVTIAEIPSAVLIYDGAKIVTPIVKGKPADELKTESKIAFDRVKQQFGLKWGKKYKVFANTIEDLSEPQSST